MERQCNQCQLVSINGIVCHETGCPEAFRDDVRECKWCGSDFVPTDRWQTCCDVECLRAYSGE